MKHFSNRFLKIAKLWAWFMRRRGFETRYMIKHTHIGVRFVVRALEPGETIPTYRLD